MASRASVGFPGLLHTSDLLYPLHQVLPVEIHRLGGAAVTPFRVAGLLSAFSVSTFDKRFGFFFLSLLALPLP